MSGMEFYSAIDFCKNGKIVSNANICSGMEFGTNLADYDIACLDKFTGVPFNAQHFWLGIASVSRRAYAFFVRHCRPLMLSSIRQFEW